jgi:hypothetical protein
LTPQSYPYYTEPMKISIRRKRSRAVRLLHSFRRRQSNIVKARTVGSTVVLTVPVGLRRVFKLKPGNRIRFAATPSTLTATFV